MKTTAQIQADFDKIARVDRSDEWNHNNHYHEFLLRQLPAHCDSALEVGCGTGAFARLLAARADRVLALDLSPEMLRLARERSAAFPQIEYVQADVMDLSACPPIVSMRSPRLRRSTILIWRRCCRS